MRLVLDTNIVISGLLWGGTPRQLLELGRDGQIDFFTSSVLLGELVAAEGRTVSHEDAKTLRKGLV